MDQPKHPISGTDYPGTFQEFDEWFSSEDACLDYIAKVRWPDSFIYPGRGCKTQSPAFQKYGASALGLQRVLGLGSYNTAWTWLHKLRRAMVRPERD